MSGLGTPTVISIMRTRSSSRRISARIASCSARMSNRSSRIATWMSPARAFVEHEPPTMDTATAEPVAMTARRSATVMAGSLSQFCTIERTRLRAAHALH
jgi:hypothetical protein